MCHIAIRSKKLLTFGVGQILNINIQKSKLQVKSGISGGKLHFVKSLDLTPETSQSDWSPNNVTGVHVM